MTDALLSPSIGWTFLPMDDKATSIPLSNIIAKNMDPDTDCLQVLDPETTVAKSVLWFP